ncbi:MAG TPA: translation initiation factor IF-2, partial [Chthonomonadaceae bacterium]|nr:translation initiation factor IF-2 [Chthonomonadaceae bacterium]
RALGESRTEQARSTRLEGTIKRVTLAELARKVNEGTVKDLNLIVKADVQGSVEAVLGELAQIEENKTEAEVRIVVKLSGVGPISETDVDLAAATNSLVIGFNVKPDLGATRAAERSGVEIRTYNIIYDLTEDVERAMKGMLTPIYEESPLGKAEVRQSFRTPKGITIAGSYVTDGKLVRGGEVRLRRGAELLYTGKIDTLRRIKDDVREVAQGFECGLTLADYNEPYLPGDLIECFEMKQVMRQ